MLNPIVTAALVAGSVLNSKAILFDFESVVATPQGSLTHFSLPMTSGGLTATITRSGGAGFDVVDLFGGPASWGDHSLSPFNTFPGDSFIVNFSAPISSASIEFGDHSPSDNDSSVTFTLGSAAQMWTDLDGFPSVGSLGVAGLGILSIAFTSGGDFPNSLYWDNLNVVASTSVPDGGTSIGLLALGLLALGAFRFTRSQANV